MIDCWNSMEVESILNLLEEGVIVVDAGGYIQLYNRKAREIFGLDVDIEPGHLEGSIAGGDWVILADNWLGRDDGGLKPADLAVMGVEIPTLTEGMAVAAIGRYGAKAGAVAKAKTLSELKNKVLQVELKDGSHHLQAVVNHKDHKLIIKVDGQSFDFYYRLAAGHLVVLDGETFALKFHQTRGYTARGESVLDILKGKTYSSKGRAAGKHEVLGRHFTSVHPAEGDNGILLEVLRNGFSMRGTELEINGIATICFIEPLLLDGQRRGTVLILEDISDLRFMVEERESALASVQLLAEQIENQEKAALVFERVVGRSKAITEIIHLASRAATSNSTVLLLGESGTGKGLIALAIHDASRRSAGPFIYINCASIPENLLESELFGYDAGAFTGATKEGKPGKFELAHDGTIFLDEIGDLPLSMQAKLLHVLQERRIVRLGGNRTKEIDVRIIAATNRNLEKMVQSGSFREDLYYRIHVIALTLPPLRERREDIPDLINYLLPQICKRVGVKPIRLSEEALQYLVQYSWPGNVRELENVLEMAVNISVEDTIGPESLPVRVKTGWRTPNTEPLVKIAGLSTLSQLVDECEKQAILEALKISQGNRTRAMELLSIGRTQFYEKLKKYEIE